MNFTCFILPFFNVSTRDLKLYVQLTLYFYLTALFQTITFYIILGISFLRVQVHIVIYYIKFILFISQLKNNPLQYKTLCLYNLNTRPINISQMSLRNVYRFIITPSFKRSASFCFTLINFTVLRCYSRNSTVIQNLVYSLINVCKARG